MTISQQEFNKVVEGLEMQLQLHIMWQQELCKRIDVLQELRKSDADDLLKAETLLTKFVVCCSKCGTCVRREKGKWIHIMSDGGYIYKPHKVIID